MKPICVPCQRFYRCKKNDYAFIEAMPKSFPPPLSAAPGTDEPQNWDPYKIWFGDLWECEGCSAQIVVGVAREPLAEHYQEHFDRALKHYAPELQVNDC